MKGYDATMGFAHLVGRPSTADAACVALLKEAGAVPFCTTNVPQTLISYACANPVYGVTSHPMEAQSQRGPGGSSGGEAALTALGGNVFGIGTDGGGSIRNPCAASGVVGLKVSRNAPGKNWMGRRAFSRLCELLRTFSSKRRVPKAPIKWAGRAGK